MHLRNWRTWLVGSAVLGVLAVYLFWATYRKRLPPDVCHEQRRSFEADEENVGGSFFPPDAMTADEFVLEVPDAGAPDRNPLIEILPDRVTINLQPVGERVEEATRSRLTEMAISINENSRLFNRPISSFHLDVAIARNAQWAMIKRVLGVISESDFHQIDFVFARPIHRPPTSLLNGMIVRLFDEPEQYLSAVYRPLALSTAPHWGYQAVRKVAEATIPYCTATGILAKQTDSDTWMQTDRQRTNSSLAEECGCTVDWDLLRAYSIRRWLHATHSVFVGGRARFVVSQETALSLSYSDDQRWGDLAIPLMARLAGDRDHVTAVSIAPR